MEGIRPLGDREIAARLRAVVGDMPISQVAERVGVNSETMRRYLGGRGRIPASVLARIAVAFGVSPTALLLECDNQHDADSIFAERARVALDRLTQIRTLMSGVDIELKALTHARHEAQARTRSPLRLANQSDADPPHAPCADAARAKA